MLVTVAYAAGTAEDIDKLARRQVKPTKQHNEECRKLLGLMGIPFLIVSELSQQQSIARQ
jgi:flap endonuclease-1